jgi:dihydroneopterin aldolase
MAVISLVGMRFHSYHGCFDEEQVIGTDFIVDVSLDADTSIAQLNDDISATVNYQDVYNEVADEMSKQSHLLEHVAERILDRLMSGFDSIRWASVKVSKLNPPLGGQIAAASVQLESYR